MNGQWPDEWGWSPFTLYPVIRLIGLTLQTVGCGRSRTPVLVQKSLFYPEKYGEQTWTSEQFCKISYKFEIVIW